MSQAEAPCSVYTDGGHRFSGTFPRSVSWALSYVSSPGGARTAIIVNEGAIVGHYVTGATGRPLFISTLVGCCL